MTTEKTEVKVSAKNKEGMEVEATASLSGKQRLHVEPSNGGFTFYVSNGGEVCQTSEEAKDLQREHR